ncbi:MAG: Stp1/IreP family PP2C-type Ser/Thr phosphatase [Gammaproteobacteria bacterium]|nr:Stp1/IreP family PP2C-type Ser/Thr phosphatase [Gammaproteobacteria bacterium]
MMQIRMYGGTDRGMVRENNQDCIGYMHFEHSDISVAIVADGVGGHAGGEIASRLAVDEVEEFLRKAVLQATSGGGYSDQWLEQTLGHAIAAANSKIIKQQQHDEKVAEMATTIVSVLMKDDKIALSYLGDSRCYLWQDNRVKLLTKDHTIAQQLLDEGAISRQQYSASPYHHVINQALGLKEEVEPEVTCLTAQPNDTYLLCSDGLTNCLNDRQIAKLLDTSPDIESCVDELITQANDAGGVDNISVVLIQYQSPDLL